LIATTLQKDA